MRPIVRLYAACWFIGRSSNSGTVYNLRCCVEPRWLSLIDNLVTVVLFRVIIGVFRWPKKKKRRALLLLLPFTSEGIAAWKRISWCERGSERRATPAPDPIDVTHRLGTTFHVHELRSPWGLGPTSPSALVFSAYFSSCRALFSISLRPPFFITFFKRRYR